MFGSSIAASMRLVITWPGERSLECTLATTMSSAASTSGVECREHVRGLIESSILVDVNLNAAENTKWWRSRLCLSDKLSVDALDLFELPHEALSRESVGNGEVGRVIGQHDVLMTQ